MHQQQRGNDHQAVRTASSPTAGARTCQQETEGRYALRSEQWLARGSCHVRPKGHVEVESCTAASAPELGVRMFAHTAASGPRAVSWIGCRDAGSLAAMIVAACMASCAGASPVGQPASTAVAEQRPTRSTPPPCAAAIECERRCTASEDGMSCTEAARRSNGGDGVVRDSHRGLSLASRACTLSVAKGCTLAASIAEFGESSAGLPPATPTPEVCARVRAFQSRGCNLGDPEGCAAYGEWLHGEAIDRSIIDREAAGCVLNGLVDTSCMDELRARQATYNAFLARLSARFGCPLADAAVADPPRGLSMLVEACRKGSETGCFWAAGAFDAGVGTPKDGAAAQRYWEESCRLGGLSGCGIAARRLKDTNPERAATLLRSACSARGLGECAELASLLGA